MPAERGPERGALCRADQGAYRSGSVRVRGRKEEEAP